MLYNLLSNYMKICFIIIKVNGLFIISVIVFPHAFGNNKYAQIHKCN